MRYQLLIDMHLERLIQYGLDEINEIVMLNPSSTSFTRFLAGTGQIERNVRDTVRVYRTGILICPI